MFTAEDKAAGICGITGRDQGCRSRQTVLILAYLEKYLAVRFILSARSSGHWRIS
jgi:hypothetical protein